jgi:predicted transposase YdaD
LVANNLLKMGLTVEQVAKASEFSVEKVIEIKNKI